MQMMLDGRPIGNGHPPYVIAEVSANHNGSLDRAKNLLRAIKAAGADAAKLQTFTADSLTIDSHGPEFMINDGLWAGSSLYELYEKAAMPIEWNQILFDEARRIGLTIFSSPFDHAAVDLLEDLGTPAYKIASFEMIDLPLIRYAAATGKPLIISTGMADAEEIGEAVAAARDAGCKELALLHCVSGYPAPPEDYNLHTLADMAARFGTIVGLSDHTLDNNSAIAAVALGASLVEKHVTLDRQGGGPDDSFSLEPNDLARLCNDARTVWTALGQVNYGLKSSERANVQFRRSLYFVRDVNAGETISADAVRSIRPGYGLAPKHLDEVVGARARTNLTAGTPVSLGQFERRN